MVKLFLKTAAARFEATLAAVGAVPAFAKLVGAADQLEDGGDGDEWMCKTCGKWFTSTGGLFQHERKAHGAAGPMDGLRARVARSCCPCCATEFHTRTRLLRHLVHGATACVAFAAGLPLLADEARQVEDAAEVAQRAARRKAGLRDHAGLPVLKPCVAPEPGAGP